uniref:PhoLip_ATPase_C domain-containing protein n=1 Tax=Steinernema glaseri TaxID=37863 RepID=A0A1I7ZT31_9BILA
MYSDNLTANDNDTIFGHINWEHAVVLIPYPLGFVWWIVIGVLSLTMTTMIESTMMRLYMYAIKDPDLVPESVGFYEGDFDNIAKTKLRMLRKRSDSEDQPSESKKPSTNMNKEDAQAQNPQEPSTPNEAKDEEKTDLDSIKEGTTAAKPKKDDELVKNSVRSAKKDVKSEKASMRSASRRLAKNVAIAEGLEKLRDLEVTQSEREWKSNRKAATSLKANEKKTSTGPPAKNAAPPENAVTPVKDAESKLSPLDDTVTAIKPVLDTTSAVKSAKDVVTAVKPAKDAETTTKLEDGVVTAIKPPPQDATSKLNPPNNDAPKFENPTSAYY